MQKTLGTNWNVEIWLSGLEEYAARAYRMRTSTSFPRNTFRMGSALLTKVPNPYFGQIPASSSLGRRTIAQQQLLRPYPRFTNVALFRDNVGNSTYNAAAAKLEKRLSHGLTVTASYTFSKLHRRRFERLLADHLHRAGSQQHRRGGRQQPPPGEGRLQRRHSARFRARLGLRDSRGCGRSPVGKSAAWSACRPETRWRSRRPRTTTRAWGSPSRGPIASATPTSSPAARVAEVFQHRRLHRRAAVCDRQQLAQPGSRARDFRMPT